MAANVESFILKIGIQGDGEVTAATKAMQALEERTRAEQQALAALGGSLDAAKAKLAQMQAAASLSNGKSVNIGGMLAQREKIAGIEAKQAQGGANVAKLQGAMPALKAKADASEIEKASEAGKEAAVSFKKLGAAASETDGPLGNFLRTIGKFKAAGTAGAILAIIGVLIAVATAAVVAAVAMTKFALASADAARSARLMANAASGVVDGGEGMTSVIDDVAMKSPLAREKIAEMARAMEIARLRGRDMQNALEATATATSAVGASAGAAFTSIAEKSQMARRFLLSRNDFTGVSAELEGTGVAFADVAQALATAQGTTVARAAAMIKAGQVSVAAGLDAMNAAVQAKFGKTVAAQMLAVDTQFKKMHESFAKLFEGIDLEPFLQGLRSITSMFDQNTVTGAALKTLFKSIFEPLADSAGTVFPIIEGFIQGMVIAVLMMYLGFLKVKAAISEAFGGSSASKIDWVKTAMWAGGIAVTAFVGGTIALTVAIIALVAVMLPLAILFSLPFLLAIGLIGLVIYAFYKLYDAVANIQAPDMSTFGIMAVTSIENGILSKLSSVGAAMKKIALAMLAALPNALIMHSPSVLLTEQSKMAVQSVVDPLEDGAEPAGKAMAKLGGGRPDFSGAKGASGSRGGRGTVVEKGAIVIHVTSEDMATKVRRVILDVLGSAAGSSPEPEPAT